MRNDKTGECEYEYTCPEHQIWNGHECVCCHDYELWGKKCVPVCYDGYGITIYNIY